MEARDDHDDYWAPRRSLRDPIPELFECAWRLDLAVGSHLENDRERVASFISLTNSQKVRDYVESLWGAASAWPEQVHYKRLRPIDNLPATVPNRKEPTVSRAVKLALVERDGFQCRYCDLPVIPAEVRQGFCDSYPELEIWGRTNPSQHAGFQALWLQYDHVLPLALGGGAGLDNMVICCAGCNYCKWHYHLDELGLIDPFIRPPRKSQWDGLTRFFGGKEKWLP